MVNIYNSANVQVYKTAGSLRRTEESFADMPVNRRCLPAPPADTLNGTARRDERYADLYTDERTRKLERAIESVGMAFKIKSYDRLVFVTVSYITHS